jgi:hypothetical protein
VLLVGLHLPRALSCGDPLLAHELQSSVAGVAKVSRAGATLAVNGPSMCVLRHSRENSLARQTNDKIYVT